MPHLDEQDAPTQVMPEFSHAIERPDPIGGVSAADAADINDLRARRAPTQDRAADAVAPIGIWSPATALILVMVAVTMQVIAVYARVALPKKVNTGQPLDQFELLVQNLPVLNTMAGSYLAMGLGLAAALLILLGARRGIKDLPLQAAVCVLAVFAIAGSSGFALLAG